MNNIFIKKLINRIKTIDSLLCVGLDSRYDRLPEFAKANRSVFEAILYFNSAVVRATHDLTSAYKSNLAFYGGFGAEALEALRQTNLYIQANYSEIVTLADCKRSEMGDSVSLVKSEIFDWLAFDCVMVTPWFGSDTIMDYLNDQSKGVCVYVHDSNPSAPEIQAVKLHDGRRLYEYLADLVANKWNSNGNVFIEVGATYPAAFSQIRKIVGDEMLILTAGIGAQGGKVSDIEKFMGKDNQRMLVNSSRGIIFAGANTDTEEVYLKKVRNAALKLRNELRANA